MKKMIALIFLIMSSAVFAAPKPNQAGKAPVKKSKPTAKSTDQPTTKPKENPAPVQGDSEKKTEPVAEKIDGSLDVTVTGESKDEAPLIKTPPPENIPFQEIVSSGREGKTERVLNSPIQHMSGEEEIGLLQMDSRQTFLPLPAKIPQPPVFRMEMVPGLSASSWEFQVVDQGNRVIYRTSGKDIPKNFLEWDGFDGGRFLIHPGPALTPILLITTEKGQKQKYFGDPIRLSAVQYVEGGQVRVELDNERIYDGETGDFSKNAAPILQAALHILRRNAGGPIHLTLYQNPSSRAPSQKRLNNWRKFIDDGLLLPAESLILNSSAPSGKGEITEIVISEKP